MLFLQLFNSDLCSRLPPTQRIDPPSSIIDIRLIGKMSSNICASNDKENHGESYEMAVVGKVAEKAPKLKDISNQLTEKPKECQHAEKLESIKALEKNTAVPDEEKGGTNWDGPELWSDIPLNGPDKDLEASDRATWLIVEKGKLICRSMSPNLHSIRPTSVQEGREQD